MSIKYNLFLYHIDHGSIERDQKVQELWDCWKWWWLSGRSGGWRWRGGFMRSMRWSLAIIFPIQKLVHPSRCLWCSQHAYVTRVLCSIQYWILTIDGRSSNWLSSEYYIRFMSCHLVSKCWDLLFMNFSLNDVFDSWNSLGIQMHLSFIFL